jgi:hypothetical protein
MVITRSRRWAVTALLVWWGVAPLSAQAALQAYVDHNPVAEDESFTLTLESSGDVDGAPDWSPLKQDFDVQGQSKNSSLSIVNGLVTRSTRWLVSLMAKHSGRLQIPSISVGGEHSQPLTITVTPASQAQAQQQGGDLFMEVSADPTTAYVQQQIIYTVRLFHALDLGSGSSLSQPDLPNGNAVVEKLGKDNSYQSVRNGMRYDVIERRFALYPQKSGAMDIAPVQFDGDIVEGGGGNGMFAFGIDPFNQRTRHKRLRSRAVHITVKPVPAAFHGGQWLPARSLKLEQSWSPDPPQFQVGQPVTRTLSMMADGLTASQLPVLGGAHVSGVKQYPDQPSLNETQSDNGITGLRNEKTAFIPIQPGKISLPAIEIPWWNTVTDRPEVASLPARTFTVAPAATGGAPVPPPAAVATEPSPQSVQPATPTAPTPPELPASIQDRWPWVALLLAGGWLVTLVAWWRYARRRTPRGKPVSADDGPMRRLEAAVKAGCMVDDAVRTQLAVLAWARRRWPDQPPLSLTAVARRCPGPLSDALAGLDRALHGYAASSWQGQTLWREYTGYKHDDCDRKAQKDSGLQPLYQNQ